TCGSPFCNSTRHQIPFVLPSYNCNTL
ncbi:uncharacterized protein METZ01_LOCUS91944, partial [marine metagenome]